MSGDSAGRTPNNRDLDPTGEAGAAMGPTPDCPSDEGSWPTLPPLIAMHHHDLACS